ncbi:unnamed protein product [Adineta ricciae]|uniref:Uncharacterized protein n=1 Tax=Adineta ricciae TaxID=249248 RepID=A0A815LD43_ADIRI|nr:unnamed protein product [Adineta ricciae]
MASTTTGKITEFRRLLSNARSVLVLTGAGISAESGVPTFRGAGGFWRQFRATVRYSVHPWQGALCGSLAGGIAACLTTPFDVAKTRIMLAHHSHTDAASHSLKIMKNIVKNEGFPALYSGVLPRTTWISIGGLIYFGSFEFVTSWFFSPNN